MKTYLFSYKIALVMVLASVCHSAMPQTMADNGDSLTVDSRLQHLSERLLSNKQGSIVAIEPSTGRVLAMASNDVLNDGVNRAIAMSYSPGSTFKVAQALAMLSEGALDTERTYPCREGFTYNKIHIGCHPHPSNLTLVDAIGHSCNSYFCKAFQEYIDDRTLFDTKFKAVNRWADYMHSMGLGIRLGIDLEGEAVGEIPDSAFLQQMHRSWNGTTIMWVGMGQGEVMTTPLQLCNLAAVIANRGYYYTPYIHRSALRTGSFTERHLSLALPSAFDIVIDGMRAAIEHGTAASIDSPDYAICGKTGTAENTGDDHSIFIGFAPMERPRIAVCVYIENGGFGADLSAPLAALLIEQYINGHLSEESERRAEKWEHKKAKTTSVLVPVSLDDM